MSALDMPRRSVAVAVHLDANRINSRGGLEHVNQLEQWHEDGVILLEMARPAHEEAKAGTDPRRRRKALGHIFTLTYADTGREQRRLKQVEEVLFPGKATTQNERNDVEIVFNADKYGAILVTADGASKSQPGGILGHREQLSQMGIQIMRDSEAVDHIRERISIRDRNARLIAGKTGKALPSWVGED